MTSNTGLNNVNYTGSHHNRCCFLPNREKKWRKRYQVGAYWFLWLCFRLYDLVGADRRNIYFYFYRLCHRLFFSYTATKDAGKKKGLS